MAVREKFKSKLDMGGIHVQFFGTKGTGLRNWNLGFISKILRQF